MAGFMPAVWYSKDAAEAEEQGSKEDVNTVAESAKILKGDHIVTAQETFKKAKLQKRRYISEIDVLVSYSMFSIKVLIVFDAY